jgi:hypothetical protein
MELIDWDFAGLEGLTEGFFGQSRNDSHTHHRRGGLYDIRF